MAIRNALTAILSDTVSVRRVGEEIKKGGFLFKHVKSSDCENSGGTADRQPLLLTVWPVSVGRTSHSCRAALLCCSYQLASTDQKEKMVKQKLPLLVSHGNHAGTPVTQALQVGLRKRRQHNEQHNPNIKAFNSCSPRITEVSVKYSWVGQ